MDKKSSGKIFSSAVLILSGILFFSRPEPVRAQFEEEEFFKVDEWVETASKRLQRVEEAPAAVTLISEDEIRQSGATNLGDLLRRVPGLEVMALTTSDIEIGARGMNKPLENGILVLVDGRSIYQDFFGLVLWNFMDFPLEQIEKIEVVRGPGSVLYGANAMHAVINIFTKTPGDSPGAMLSLTAGPRNLIGTVMESGTQGKVSHLLSAGWAQAASYENTNNIRMQYPRSRVSLLYDLGKQSNVRLDVGIAGGNDDTFYDAIGWVKSSTVSQNVMVQYNRPNFYFRTFWNSIDGSRVTVPNPLFSQMSLLKMMNIGLDPGWQLDMALVNNVLDFESQKILELGKNNFLTLGGNYRYNAVKCKILPKYETLNLFGAYLQDEFHFRNLISSFLGVRYDNNPISGSNFSLNNFSPRGSLLFTPLAGHSFRVSAGRSFRRPTFIESYSDIELPFNVDSSSFGSAHFTGNPDLQSEELTSYEVGYLLNLFRGMLKGSFNFFYNQYSNLVGVAYPEGILKFKADFENQYDEDARGIEAEARISPYSWLSTFVNYSYTDVYFTEVMAAGKKEKVTQAFIDSLGYPFAKTDRRTPQNKINAGITINLKNGISSTAMIHYVGRTFWWPNLYRDPNPQIEFFQLGPVPAYTLLNLRVGYRFLHDRAEAAVSVENLLNDEHKEFPVYGETIGTQINGSVRISF
ncbi:MAG: TonB-dependent receptor [bacterium]|nr:TonB-dependent receptor [bacterium]